MESVHAEVINDPKEVNTPQRRRRKSPKEGETRSEGGENTLEASKISPKEATSTTNWAKHTPMEAKKDEKPPKWGQIAPPGV